MPSPLPQVAREGWGVHLGFVLGFDRGRGRLLPIRLFHCLGSGLFSDMVLALVVVRLVT